MNEARTHARSLHARSGIAKLVARFKLDGENVHQPYLPPQK